MSCPECRVGDTKVINSRDVTGGVRRRRECKSCDYRFTTFERLSPIDSIRAKRHRQPDSEGVR